MNEKFMRMNQRFSHLKCNVPGFIDMERRALVLALALTLPLALYGVPYAYAATTQSTYVVVKQADVGPFSDVLTGVRCSSPLDSTQHFAVFPPDFSLQDSFTISVRYSWLNNSAGGDARTGDNPNGWTVALHNPSARDLLVNLQIVCQSPITVAGISVPEFGSLYVAIALGAVAYFALSRQYPGTRTAQATTRA